MTEAGGNDETPRLHAPRSTGGSRFQPVDWVAWATVAATLLAAVAFALR